jgi:hypothetical protein
LIARENKENMHMSDNGKKKTVFAITERDGKSYWTRIGAAFTNGDGSINVALDALPVSGRLQIREDEEHEGRAQDRNRR